MCTSDALELSLRRRQPQTKPATVFSEGWTWEIIAKRHGLNIRVLLSNISTFSKNSLIL